MADKVRPDGESVEEQIEEPVLQEFDDVEEGESVTDGISDTDLALDSDVSAVGKDPATVYAGLLKRRVYSGIWGPAEIVSVGVGGFLLLAAILFYLFFVIPADRELAAGRQQRDTLDTDLRAAREKWGGFQNTETQAAKLLTSAEDFEARALKDESVGRTAIYQRLNVLINTYGLRNTSGPDYVPLEIGDKRSGGRESEAGKKGRDKLRSLFPGIFITTTVEGPYTALRGFIRDIESSSEFMAISSIELEPSDEVETKAETQTVEVSDKVGRKTAQRFRKGRYRGKIVSLRIEMAAYFRRPAEQRLNTSTNGGTPETSSDLK